MKIEKINEKLFELKRKRGRLDTISDAELIEIYTKSYNDNWMAKLVEYGKIDQVRNNLKKKLDKDIVSLERKLKKKDHPVFEDGMVRE